MVHSVLHMVSFTTRPDPTFTRSSARCFLEAKMISSSTVKCMKLNIGMFVPVTWKKINHMVPHTVSILAYVCGHSDVSTYLLVLSWFSDIAAHVAVGI